VVAIVDVDMTADGLVFMVMELVRGTPLHHFRERYGDRGFALQVLRQITDGLRTVHAHNIVHRDLKPANVLIAESPDGLQVKLVDFGVSTLTRGKSQNDLEKAPLQPPTLPALADEPSSNPNLSVSADASAGSASGDVDPKQTNPRGHLTAVGIVVGTPMYLAPELAEGSRLARPPSDIFSLGVIAYELLGGSMPFSEPPVVTRYRGATLSIPSLHAAHPELGLPPALVALIDRCLAEDPAIRPTAAELLAVLLAVLDAPQG
jgi:serine/threonine protein kinase